MTPDNHRPQPSDHEIDQLLRGLEADVPETAPPPWPVERLEPRKKRPPWWLAVGPVLAAAAAAALWILPDAPETTLKGSEMRTDSEVELRIVRQRDGITSRLDGPPQPGDLLLFQASADPAATVYLHVAAPGEEALLTPFDATPDARNVQAEGGLLGYEITASGTHTFTVSVAPEPEDCQPPSCNALSFDVP